MQNVSIAGGAGCAGGGSAIICAAAGTTIGSGGAVRQRTVPHAAQAMYNLIVAQARTFFFGDDGWLAHKC